MIPMNKEEIEELKDFTIDLTDIDELALGLEVCSKKSNMVIQEFADTIIQLQQENRQLKDNWNKLKEYIRGTKLKEFEKSYGKRNGRTFTQAEIVVCNMILDKMQEPERSDSNE